MFKKITLTTTLLFLIIISQAQTGKIIGKIVDSKTGETLPGATVLIEGTTKGVSSDFDGNFSLGGLQPGKYNLIASYITYDNKKFVDVVVKANDVTDFNITLDQSSSQTLGEVVVQAEMNKENTNAVLIMQKNNASVSDGISSESIKKTPDRSTSDVIKRISGATIQDNKFAIIRGMSDRYNAAFINGAPLPSSESDKKAFSFDIFPANILDNIIILKTATPDMSGEFAGGVININTKSIPEKNSQSISIGGGYNSQTTFKNFKTYKGGKTDWLGIDDGTRAMPGAYPNPAFTTDKNQQIEDAKLFNYDWTIKNKKALPNMNFQYTMANVGKVFKRDIGSVFALTYNSTNNTTYTTRRTFSEELGENNPSTKTSDYKDTTFSSVVLASALWNLSYKIHPNHQIGFKNLYSVNTEDRVITRKGAAIIESPNNTWEKSNVRWFTQNNIYSGQLNGDHYIEKAKLKMKWVAGYSDIKRELPNLRRMTRTKSSALEDDSIPYTAVIGSQGSSPTSAGSMIFQKTKESMKSIKYDISRVFHIGKSKHEIQIGGSHIFRERTFYSRLLGYNFYTYGSKIFKNDSLLTLDDADIFNNANIGIVNGAGKRDGGFLMVESTTPNDNYQASAMLHAGYLMSDSRFFDNKLRFIYGARVESYRQKLSTIISGVPGTTDSTVIDILPSINIVYGVTDKINIRLAYFKTVARPEFRELAAFTFFDFTTGFRVTGNPNLKRSSIDNYDVRAEWFPGAGQIVSISGFYKKINNAIEQVLEIGNPNSTTFANSQLAQNVGGELEYRFKLNTLFNTDSSKFLSNTTIFSNFAYIQSKVDNRNANGGEIRPLQGQSPYIINAGIQYLDNDNDWGVSISYNWIGRRIVIVGSPKDEPSIWENPRHVLDLQISKTFKKKFEIKLNVRDMIAQNQIRYQDINNNGKLDKGSENENKNLTHSYQYDDIFMNTKVTPTISFSLSYKIY